MSQSVEIKVRIDKDKKARFDGHCKSLNVSQNGRMNDIIDADLEGRIAQGVIAPPADTPQSEAELRRADYLALRTELSRLFQQNREAMAGHLLPLKTIASAKFVEERFDKIATRQKASETGLKDIKAGQASAQDALLSDVRALTRKLDQTHPIWYRDQRFLGGVTLGVVAALLLAFLLPGSSAPARALARFAVGEADPVEAAGIVAGGGSESHATAITITLQLAGNKRFLDSYQACIDQARAARKATSCVIQFPVVR
jgi:hypothetical protein